MRVVMAENGLILIVQYIRGSPGANGALFDNLLISLDHPAATQNHAGAAASDPASFGWEH